MAGPTEQAQPDQYRDPRVDTGLVQALAAAGSPGVYALRPEALHAAGVRHGAAPYQSHLLNTLAFLAQWAGLGLPGRGGLGSPMPNTAGFQALGALLRRYLPEMAQAGGSLPRNREQVERGLRRAEYYPLGSRPGDPPHVSPRVWNRDFPEVQSAAGGQRYTGHPLSAYQSPEARDAAFPRLVEIMEYFYGPRPPRGLAGY